MHRVGVAFVFGDGVKERGWVGMVGLVVPMGRKR